MSITMKGVYSISSLIIPNIITINGNIINDNILV